MLHSREPIAGDGLFAAPGLFDMHSTRMAWLLAGVGSAAGSWAMWPRFTWQILNSPIIKKQFGD